MRFTGTIDECMAAAPPEVLPVLQAIRAAIRQTPPLGGRSDTQGPQEWLRQNRS